jgi:prepilin-type N-terminal cleavage/methylation domain-containing protein
MFRHAPIRRGFTLVELLVAIAIIGVLVALLLPAVQSAREAARRTQCLNNLKQLTLATHNFHQQYSFFPTYFGKFPEKDPAAAEGGWIVHLLPFIEQGFVHDTIVANGGTMGQKRFLVTPASPDYRAAYWEYPAGGYWETISGGDDGGTDHQGHTYPRRAPTTRRWVGPPPIYHPQVGTGPVYRTETYGIDSLGDVDFSALHCPSDPSGVPANRRITFRYGSGWALTNYMANYHAWTVNGVQSKPRRMPEIEDGLSNTVLLGEGMRLCDGTYRIAFWSHYGFQHSHNFGVDWTGVPNTFMFQSAARSRTCNNWRAQGMHHGQLAVALADGSVRTIHREISRKETSNPDAPEWGVDPIMGDGELGVWDRLLIPVDGQPIGDLN